MSAPLITVENLSKRYVIGHQRDARDGLRHAVENLFRNPFQWLRNWRKQRAETREEFWALQDISFEVNQGDVVGIIGRNGAGKSTLLKILSRITEPTSGRIHLRGRVASLLEVGTGFHQELTGRENIFLNGAILGMTRAEIKRKFDEIVAFSEVEKFLDTPVKRYSSGMYVRLAFAVAAHLEPEILIVDEVLAVGDAAFQKKCLGKMGEVAKGGRTVLFVSHNMSAVQALCGKAVFLQSGRLKAVGSVEHLLAEYLAQSDSFVSRTAGSSLALGDSLELAEFTFAPASIETGKSLRLRLRLQATKAVTVNELAVLFFTSQNTRVAIVDLRAHGLPARLAAGQAWELEGEIQAVPFVEGDYSVGLYLNAGGTITNDHDIHTISVHGRPATGLAPFPAAYRGVVELDFALWRLKVPESAANTFTALPK